MLSDSAKESVKAATERLAAARQDDTAAVDAVSVAKTALKTANENVATVKTQKSEKISELDDNLRKLRSDKEKAKKAKDAADSTLSSAKASYDAASDADKAAALSRVDGAQAAADAMVTAMATSKDAVSAAETEKAKYVQDKDTEIESKENIAESAKVKFTTSTAKAAEAAAKVEVAEES